MPTLSLITAVLPAMAKHIGETDTSVGVAKEIFAGSGWEIEWIVAIDGPGEIATLLNADRILTLPRKSAVSAARNYALANANGDWVAPLDGDDTIEAAGVLAIVQAIGADETASWIGANRVHMDGSRTPHWRDEISEWAMGEFAPLWAVPFPFHPNSILARRKLALAIGGWPALPCNEDVGFVLSLSEAGPGRFTSMVFNRYRLWELQTIADPVYPEIKLSAFVITEAVINAKRLLAGRDPIKAPVPAMVYNIKERA